MPETITASPVWIESDDDYLDIRCDIAIDKVVEDGMNDLFARFSFPKDGEPAYMSLTIGDETLGEIKLTAEQAARVGPALAAAVLAFIQAGGMDAPLAPIEYPIEFLTPTPTVFILSPTDEPMVGDWVQKRGGETEYPTLDDANARNKALGNRLWVFEVWPEGSAPAADGYRIKAKH